MRKLWIAGGVALWCIMAAAQDSRVFPASNDEDFSGEPGRRPYEMEWAGRVSPAHPELVDFEDITGWRTRCFDGAEARLYRSQRERIFGAYTGRVEYQGESAHSAFRIEPPEPIAIPGTFDAVNLWVYGNNWGWINPAATARVNIAVIVEDARGVEFRIPMGVVDFDYWFLMHATCVSPTGKTRHYTPIHEDETLFITFPARFAAIEVSGCSDANPARLHFDALQFYTLAYAPLTFDPPPPDFPAGRPELSPFPWPTTPDTILPMLLDSGENVPLARHGEHGVSWISHSTPPSGNVAFWYAPKDGTLSDLYAEADGVVFQPCHGGGITFDAGGRPFWPGEAGVTAVFLGEEADAEARTYRWRAESEGQAYHYAYRIRVKNKSCIVDITADEGAAIRFDIGKAQGLPQAKTVYFPYLTYGDTWPRVVCAAGNQGPIFLLSLLDHYNTNASEFAGTPRYMGGGGVAYNGGALYHHKTDGARNPLFERLFVTVSDNVHEVLPSVPNPPCDTGDIAREYVWRNIGPAFQEEMLTRYKAYGIDKFIACHHEVGWREGGESFTLRDRPAPSIGEERLAAYGAFVRGLGYHFGTYTNYMDYAPVNENWDEDMVALDPEGRWQRAWPRCHVLKPLRAAEMQAYYAPRIKERYGANAQYCDVHTAFTPWGRNDYDARTPGAGMFRTQFNAYARLLMNESVVYEGPVFSEGNYHWFYAGIVDGNYATMLPYGRGWMLDPLVDFDLLHMHPKMTDFGMGMPLMYFGEKGEWRKNPSRLSPWFDRFHTAAIAFGHIGYLAEEWGFDGTLKSYYLMQALQQRYAMVPVSRIAYYDGAALRHTSEALASDAYQRRQVHIVYENGLAVWCNLNEDLPWLVTLEDREYLLPPFGFLAYREGDILAYSAACGGPRHELAQCADYLYCDSRGALARTDHLLVSGAVAVKPGGPGEWWIIPALECGPVSISRAWLNAARTDCFEAAAYSLSGETLGAAVVRHGLDWVTVLPVENDAVVKYRLSRTAVKGLEWSAEPGPRVALAGRAAAFALHVSIPEGMNISELPVRYTWHIPGMPPQQGTILCAVDAASRAARGDIQAEMPPALVSGARIWCEWQPDTPELGAFGAYWMDFVGMPALRAELQLNTRQIHEGGSIVFEASLENNQSETAEIEVDLSVEGQCPPGAARRISIAPESSESISWTAPAAGGELLRAVRLRARAGEWTVEQTRLLRTAPEAWVVAELAHASFQTGIAVRGQGESEYEFAGTGAMVSSDHETLGGKPLDSVYMHPPYMNGTGYIFAAYEVALPPGRPKLDFAMGFRMGSTTEDGCLFIVHVIDGGRETEVFREQYADITQWAHRSADLSAFAGKKVIVKLIADVGPDDNSHSDWVLWGAPRVVMADAAYSATLLDAPDPAQHEAAEPALAPGDLSRIKAARIVLESAGVDAGIHAAPVFLNGAPMGALPPSGGDTEWFKTEIPIPENAVAAIRPWNLLQIKNPGGDYMKLRRIYLELTLDDGAVRASDTVLGPYSTPPGWPHAEGNVVAHGQDFPPLLLRIPLRENEAKN